MNASDVVIPKKMLGLTPGPDVEGLQLLCTLAVELDDGTVLRIAFPEIAVRLYTRDG